MLNFWKVNKSWRQKKCGRNHIMYIRLKWYELVNWVGCRKSHWNTMMWSIMEVLCLRWNKRHLRAYFETLMTLLQTQWFLVIVAFPCETDLFIKICYFMTVTKNAENLWQYKIRLSLIAEQIVAFASHHNIGREVKNVPPNFKLIEWQCFML